MEINVNYVPNARQMLFHSSNADECVYGGAKGGGKSCALVMEGLAYALENAGANMYFFRETYDDLEANIIKEWKDKVPRELYSYNESKHQATLINGTSVKFRYIRNFSDAEGYQGRSMDWIGVDELTKHLRESIQVLLSCLRSPKGFKPTFRATCNPGGIGHMWVKEDYIEATEYGKHEALCPVTGNVRVFIPAKVWDNDVLMANDPNYVKRLQNLPEDQRKAFLDGDWDLFSGQYFGEFKRDIHICEPFPIPDHWNRYFVCDYGLDMFAGLWIARDEQGRAYAYKEVYESGLIISEAAKRFLEVNGDDKVKIKYAPPDLQNRQKDTGKSAFDIFHQHGITFIVSDNNRIAGWQETKEWLKVYETRNEQTGETYMTSALKIFSNCKNLIRCIPAVQHDEKDPNDVAKDPHELTHITDALRYWCIMWTTPAKQLEQPKTEHDRNVARVIANTKKNRKKLV